MDVVHFLLVITEYLMARERKSDRVAKQAFDGRSVLETDGRTEIPKAAFASASRGKNIYLHN